MLFPLVTLSFTSSIYEKLLCISKLYFALVHTFFFLYTTVSVAALVLFQMYPGSRNAESVGTGACKGGRASPVCFLPSWACCWWAGCGACHHSRLRGTLGFLPTSKELVGNLPINLRWINLILISESVGFRLAFQKKKQNKRGGGAVVFCGVSFIFHAILYISVWLWNK